MKDILDEFLEGYGCLDEFYGNNPSIEESLGATNLISCAFVWKDSPEGHDFWEAIDQKWRDKLNE